MKTLFPSPFLVSSAQFKEGLSHVPAPLGGLALAIASLGSAWSILLPDMAAAFQLTTTPIATFLVIMVLLKYLTNLELFTKDLEHTVISSVMPTLTMATMVIAANLNSIAPVLAKNLWLTAVAGHITLFIAFIWHRSKEFKLEHMVPSWFVPPVGIVVACVTGSAMNAPDLTNALFIFGACAYATLLPVMLYRLVFHTRITAAASPTFAIMAAPPSLTLAGYLTITENPNLILVAFLTQLALLMTGLVWLAFTRLLRLPFSPGYAAFTFPMVIGATALLKLEELMINLSVDYPQYLLSGLARLELVIATAIVVYVSGRYLRHYTMS